MGGRYKGADAVDQGLQGHRRQFGSQEMVEMEEEEGSSAALRRVISFSDMILGFYEVRDEDGDRTAESSDQDPHGGGGENTKAFWDSQNQLLRAAMSKSSSLELRVRRQTEAALEKLKLSEQKICRCSKNFLAECRNCLLERVSELLRLNGFDSAICESKWRSTDDFPRGEHTYLDVVEIAAGRKEAERVVIELRFRQEFEVARASVDYRRFLSRLPEVFVGKPERLRSVIKLVCAAAKKCMKENNLHMPPWRKTKYMRAKWLSPFDRLPAAGPAAPPSRFFAAARVSLTARLHPRMSVEVV